jgi:hypothetical protein
MSETRPPITAGPIERAFRFLKRTSVSCGGAGDKVGVGDEDEDEDTVAVGDATVAGKRPGCVSSCAGRLGAAQIEKSKAHTYENRLVMRKLPSRSTATGQALHLPIL